MIRLLVDGIFFQLNNTGIARVWQSLLAQIAISEGIDIFFLDRGNAPDIDGINYIPFPRYLYLHGAADSILIQKVCDHYNIDVFTSTYYTSPLSTPMVLMVHDMIPELFDFDLTHRPWMEKAVAISYAQRFMTVSNNTRNDLLTLYPEINPGSVAVAHCGVDESVFYPRDKQSVRQFCKEHSLHRPYILFVGDRTQHNGYKNSQLFFDALQGMRKPDFDVFCVGGEKKLESAILESLPPGVSCKRAELSDDELATAYSGALALVYPSLYEGFGMPVIEAMASACPVITTRFGSLEEIAGDSACFINGKSTQEMQDALLKMSDNRYREELIILGLANSQRFRWAKMTEIAISQIEYLKMEADSGDYDRFFEDWASLRMLQADVDVDCVR